MTAGGSIDSVGDNKEFTITSMDNVTVYFTGGANGTKTSADDTETEKYINNIGAVRDFCLRSNQTIQIVSINGVEFTDPYTCIINKSITEKADVPTIFKMVLKPTVIGTSVKLRVRGR